MNEPAPRRSVAPVVFGIVLTCMFLAAIGYAASKRRAAEADTVPQLALIAPSDGDVVDAILIVRFTASQPITLRSSGWGYGRFHLHGWINGTAYMPGAADVREAGPNRYEWRLNTTFRGAGQLYLGWADQAHRQWPGGSTAPISIRIE
jgi:hypothetical protein